MCRAPLPHSPELFFWGSLQVVSALLLAKRVVSLCDVASRSDLAAAM